MKTATFSPSLMPPLAAMPASAASTVHPLSDAVTQPLVWRSEAFAEDLLDDDQPAPRARRGLLRRVAAAVLRR